MCGQKKFTYYRDLHRDRIRTKYCVFSWITAIIGRRCVCERKRESKIVFFNPMIQSSPERHRIRSFNSRARSFRCWGQSLVKIQACAVRMITVIRLPSKIRAWLEREFSLCVNGCKQNRFLDRVPDFTKFTSENGPSLDSLTEGSTSNNGAIKLN